MKFCIVGGAGYLGYHIGLQLVSEGHSVVIFDIRQPSKAWVNPAADIQFYNGSLLNSELLEDAFRNADCVIHTASYGMSGKEQLPSQRDQTENVNVNGTVNVVNACCQQGVKALVYTSTFNVIFGGQRVENGDETLPYFPLNKQVDYYSRTKCIAERMVILANGKRTNSGGHLRTCTLRMAGIMGPKEERHLPRIMGLARYGASCIKYGDAENKVEFVTLQNATRAHVKAACGLLDEKKQQNIAGQAYFISDGKPISNFEYLGNILQPLGYPRPRIVVPVSIIWILACITEWIPAFFWNLTKLNPVLTKAEVFKTGVTHYFSIEKARKDFGYNPTKPNDVSEIVTWLKESGYSAPNIRTRLILAFIVFLIFAVAARHFVWNDDNAGK